MASTTVATCSLDYLVSCMEGIEGSKLPSMKQVLGHFLHWHNVLREDIRTAANFTIQRVLVSCKNTHKASHKIQWRSSNSYSVSGRGWRRTRTVRDSASQRSRIEI